MTPVASGVFKTWVGEIHSTLQVTAVQHCAVSWSAVQFITVQFS